MSADNIFPFDSESNNVIKLIHIRQNKFYIGIQVLQRLPMPQGELVSYGRLISHIQSQFGIIEVMYTA